MNRREMLKTTGTGVLAASTLSLEGCTTNWITTAIDDLPTIIATVTSVAQIVAAALGAAGISPAIAAIIATAAQAAQTALALLQQLIKDYQANPSSTVLDKIKTTLLDVQAQLGAILGAAHIDNTVLRATITFVVGTAVAVLTDILSLLPSTSTAAPLLAAPAVGKYAVKPPSSAAIKSQVNNYLSGNGYGKFAI